MQVHVCSSNTFILSPKFSSLTCGCHLFDPFSVPVYVSLLRSVVTASRKSVVRPWCRSLWSSARSKVGEDVREALRVFQRIWSRGCSAQSRTMFYWQKCLTRKGGSGEVDEPEGTEFSPIDFARHFCLGDLSLSGAFCVPLPIEPGNIGQMGGADACVVQKGRAS